MEPQIRPARHTQEASENRHIDPRASEHAGQWELVDYEERKRPLEYVDSQGENRVRFVGDWDRAETSHGSGRPIVNIYHLRHRLTGERRPFGADTAYLVMGVADRDRAHKAADRIVAAKRHEESLTRETIARAQRLAQPSKREAYLALYARNRHCDPLRLASEGIPLFKADLCHVVITQAEAGRLIAAGWAREEIQHADL